MKRFLKSETNRAFLLILVGNVVWGLWMRDDLRRVAAAARTEDSPAWAVVLLIVSLGLLFYTALEEEPPTPPFSIDR